MFFSPNPVKAAKPFTVTAQVVNSGNAPFTGKLKAVVFNSLNEELSTLGIKTIKDTLAPGQPLSGLLEFSNPALLLPKAPINWACITLRIAQRPTSWSETKSMLPSFRLRWKASFGVLASG